MKKLYLVVFVLLSILSNVNAQRKCGAMEHLHEMVKQDPSILQVREDIENFTNEFIKSKQGNAARAVITIPVVVHVLYNTSSQNVSDAQIQSQLTILNNDFRKLNSDVSSTPSVFQPLVADAEVQFCLAQRDPSGNATTGIIRKSTTVIAFSTNDAMKKASQGGSDAWPADSYLNIWVCNISGGILGYAQFPGGAAATDGIVVNFTAFGNTGTAAAPFNKGRTATHEVGHWLNLYHIWGDDNGSCTGSDNVGDTPNQAAENYGCPSFPRVSCSNGPNGDMFMNYMDYTDDACMFMFTAGQKSRMQALFATGGVRASLLNSLGCTAPNGGGTTCAAASSLTSNSVTQTAAVLSWSAVSGATSYNVQYKVSTASTWTTVNVTGNSLSLSGLTAATTYNFQVQTVCAATTSAYSTAATFTTAAVTTTCTDIYESNNTISTAKTIAVNTNITAAIGVSSDQDYFKFSNTSTQKNIRVTLTNLPADYDLRLYNSSGKLLATSQNGGTTSETLKYNNGRAGTYYARVYGYNGAFNANSCYTLNASISSTSFKEAESNSFENKKLNDIEVLLYPNPSNGNVSLRLNLNEEMSFVNITVVDLNGKVVYQQFYEESDGLLLTEMDLSSVANGFYAVTINTPAGSESRRLVISK